MILSERAQRLKPSPTITLNARAQELARSGRDIISFAVGEPDWDTFSHIKKAAIAALEAGATKYTPSGGIPELRSAVVERIKLDLGLHYEPNQCMIGVGGKQIIFNILQVLCNPGDEVIIPAPYWVSYPTMAELADAKPVIVQCSKEVNYKLTPELLKKSITSKTKVLILNSPNNPTGQVYSEQELKKLVQVLEQTSITVISDDIYDKMIFTGEKIAPHVAMLSEKLRPQVLLANSLSKTYSMTGWRLGSLVGDKKVVDACINYQSQSATCAVSFAQKGAVEALRGDQTVVKKAMDELSQRRNLCMKILGDIEGIKLVEPQGAFYIFPDISEISNSSSKFAASLLDAEGVAVVPGVEFGAEGHFRMSYTLSEKKLEEGLRRIQKFIKSVK